MSTTNTSFNNDTDMTKFKRTLLSKLMYLSLDGCLSPEAFLRVGWVFQTLQSRITSIELSDNFDDEFPPLPESYRHAIDSDNKSHLPMGGGNSIISKLPEDCVKEVFNHSPENPIDETSNILSETDITAAETLSNLSNNYYELGDDYHPNPDRHGRSSNYCSWNKVLGCLLSNDGKATFTQLLNSVQGHQKWADGSYHTGTIIDRDYVSWLINTSRIRLCN
jgi:hypothetical protein